MALLPIICKPLNAVKEVEGFVFVGYDVGNKRVSNIEDIVWPSKSETFVPASMPPKSSTVSIVGSKLLS